MRAIASSRGSATARRNERVELRLPRSAKATLERAASLSGKTLSAFLLEQGLSAAEEVLTGRHEFPLPARRYDAFLAALNAPPKALPRLEKLLRTPGAIE